MEPCMSCIVVTCVILLGLGFWEAHQQRPREHT